jgi:hypothetical protein
MQLAAEEKLRRSAARRKRSPSIREALPMRGAAFVAGATQLESFGIGCSTQLRVPKRKRLNPRDRIQALSNF